MKGISPLVASVLLIAITMSIAGILAFWVSSYTSSALPKMNRTVEECRYSNFEIYTCNLNTSTGDIILNLHNIGPYEIINITSYILQTDGIISPVVSLNGTLSSGEYKSFILSNSATGVPSSKFSKIIVGSGACSELRQETACARS